MMRDAVVEASDCKQDAEELWSRAEIAENVFKFVEEKANLQKQNSAPRKFRSRDF
jgi:hypothetical protein